MKKDTLCRKAKDAQKNSEKDLSSDSFQPLLVR
jgi:hypothetical protein